MSKLNKKIKNLRSDFSKMKLDEKDANTNPFIQFEKWFEKAVETEQPEVNAFALATCSPGGMPSARIVFLRGFSEAGFEFYSNYKSRKAKEIEANPQASLLFFWSGLQRQIRIEGRIEKLSESKSDEYFASRPRESRIGAWASTQSKVIPSRKFLDEEVKKVSEKYPGSSIPRPPFWGGYLLKPTAFEFWQGRPGRLHDRLYYSIVKGGWKMGRLSP